LPWVKSRRTRSLILRCLVSGIFFGILLAVCKSQALAQTAMSLRDLTLLTNFVRSGTGRHQYFEHGRADSHVDAYHSPGHGLLLLQSVASLLISSARRAAGANQRKAAGPAG
jgi:hypothetical protein